jgi:hypothetical protein
MFVCLFVTFNARPANDGKFSAAWLSEIQTTRFIEAAAEI